jgi:hypothetical protein
VSLVVLVSCFSIDLLSILKDLKPLGFHTTLHNIIILTNRELNLSHQPLLVLCVDQLRQVDLPERFVEQRISQRIQDG